MTALFANNYPNFVYKIITLDNRRMYLPKTLIPKIYTLRSNDYPDEGVFADNGRAKKFHITVQSTTINHGKMDDKANDQEKATLNLFIEQFLRENNLEIY
jgi:hypothetical protein